MKLNAILIGMVVITMAAPAAMAEAMVTAPMSDRVDRLEKMMNAQSGYQVQKNLQDMHDEIQSLRGMLEVQQFEIQKLKERQEAMSGQVGKGPVAVAPTPSKGAAPVAAAPVPVPPEAETKAYQSAYVLLTEQKYSAAIPALQDYIKTYPDGQYVASAYYWLGETQTIANDLEEAKKAFQTVIDKYPTSPKAVDALLKLGMVYEDAGQYDKALGLFSQVLTKYPNTPQARLAQDRTVQIQNINR